jgi:catechol 2,3-dioxygenase-like lactoylglutathione lyase family enzyme
MSFSSHRASGHVNTATLATQSQSWIKHNPIARAQPVPFQRQPIPNPAPSEPVTITAGANVGGLVVYFYDPDGYTLELFQPPT